MRRQGAVGVGMFALALVLTACAGTSSTLASPDPSTRAPTPVHSSSQRKMLALGHSIDGMWGLQTAPETWITLQQKNCEVARGLNGAAPTSVRWYVPPGDPTSAIVSKDALIGAVAAASIVSGCFDALDSSWRWPSFWAFIRIQAESGDGTDTGRAGGTVPCEDGTWSDAGGRQGACSWHDGVGE